MMKDVIGAVEDLRHHTVGMIKDIQSNMIPFWLDGSVKRVNYYRMNGVPYALTPSQTIVHVQNLRYKDKVKPRSNPVYKEPMLDLIDKNDVYPFLLFINNKFIKWSDITIVRDIHYSYIIADKTNAPYSEKIDILMLPFNVSYSEDGSDAADGYEEIFRFDDEGKLSLIGNSVISVLDKYLVYDYVDMPLGNINSYNITSVEDKYKLFSENIVFFKDNELYNTGVVKVDNLNILTLDNGNTGGSVLFKVFFHDDANVPANNILRMNNTEYVNNLIKETNQLPEDEVPQYVKDLKKDFDFKFDITKDRATNLKEAINYIYDYNPALLSDGFKSSIYIKEYTGKEVNALVKDESLIMLRRKANQHETFMIPFLNGELYPLFENVTYDFNTFNIPVYEPLEDTDILEIMYFEDVDNMILDGVVTKDNGYVGLGTYISKSNLMVYADKHPTMQYPTIAANSKLAFVVSDYTLSDDDTMTFADDYYYGKRLSFCGSNRFVYIGYNVQRKTFKFQLTDQFKYCANQAQFMVFINGRRLNNDQFNLTILKHTRPFDDLWLYTAKVLSPGDKLAVFYIPTSFTSTNVLVQEEYTDMIKIIKETRSYPVTVPYAKFIEYGNIVEVYDDLDAKIDPENYTITDNTLTFIESFEMPNKIKYKLIRKNKQGINRNGYIYVNKDRLVLPLCKELYCVFVNGKKIPQSCIVNVSTDVVRISTDIGSINNVSVVPYKYNVGQLVDMLNKHDSLIEDIMNNVDTDTIDDLMGTYNTISNSDPEFVVEASEISIINEIVRDFYMKPGITDGEPFLYDYDTDAFIRQDDDGNWIIPSMDATQFINIIEEDSDDDTTIVYPGMPFPDDTKNKE